MVKVIDLFHFHGISDVAMGKLPRVPSDGMGLVEIIREVDNNND